MIAWSTFVCLGVFTTAVVFDRAAEMGFDWIFVNPIQKPGRSGSLYSIADYFQINPRFVDQDSKFHQLARTYR